MTLLVPLIPDTTSRGDLHWFYNRHLNFTPIPPVYAETYTYIQAVLAGALLKEKRNHPTMNSLMSTRWLAEVKALLIPGNRDP